MSDSEDSMPYGDDSMSDSEISMPDSENSMLDSEDSMLDGEEVKLSLKVMINKEKTKVLFAEANSDFVDVLLSSLTLPLGRIVRILENHCGEQAASVGSLTTLYRSIANLDNKHLCQKFYLLNPTNYSSKAECFKLKLNVEATQPAMKYTKREYCKRKRSQNVKTMRKAKSTKESKTQAQATDDGDGDAGVFTVKTASFIISDDLHIASVVPGSILQTLMSVGITGIEGAEVKTVTFGFNEMKDLLEGCLVSETPLSDIILLHKSRIKKNCVTADLLHHMEKKLPSSNSKKMSEKAIVQKSTNRLLIAQGGEDFVEFLCSFLIIRLGAIECLLGSNTRLKNIDNLYRSIANVNGEKYLKSKDTKTILLKPKIDYCNMPQNHILPLVEAGFNPPYKNAFTKHVKGPATYSVTDDLTVTPFCFTSSVSVLSGLKIPLSDVKEIDLQIGVEEAMNILKASLTSTSALTNGLINPLLKKQLKQLR